MTAIVPGGVDVAFEVVGNADARGRGVRADPSRRHLRDGRLAAGRRQDPDRRAQPVLRTPAVGHHRRHATSRTATSRASSSSTAAGRLDLESLIGQRLPLERVHEAFAAAEAGTVARSVITF